MTFFYDLNKRLKDVLDTPKSEHKQLNERDMSRAAKGYEKYGKEGMEALAKAGREGKDLDPIRNKYNKYDDKKDVEEGLGDMARKVGGAVKKVASKALDKVGHGSDADMIRDLQKKMGMPQTGMKPGKEPNPKVVKEKMSPAKAKSFAALAEPKDKITFADKIAGAKKEVDEMLGDVAAEAMKKAIGGHGEDMAEAKDDDDNNPFTNWKKPRVDKPKVGDKERGHKHDIEYTATGRKVTRRVDDQGHSVGADDDSEGKPMKKGRGRPKGTKAAIGAQGPSGQSQLMTKEGAGGDDLVKLAKVIASCKTPEQLEAARKMAQNFLNKHAGGNAGAMMGRDAAVADIDRSKKALSGEELEEKAVSKKQQQFMGMVHAAQKGEKPASKEVAKVAKTMKKSDAEDFASTKHKGLPEKKKPEGKKKEKTEEAGGTGTPTASSGFGFGKGIYDSMNRDLEDMIAESMARLDATINESMSVNMSNSTEGGKSLTVTASDDDAMKLASILKMAGLGSGEAMHSDHGVVPADDQGCGCGATPCNCNEELDEVDQNQPDYPTETETSDDAMQYSGGLNGPKSTGQSTVPVLASQDDRQHSYAEAEEAAIRRMMEMAGISEAKKDVEEEKTDEGNLFTGNLAKARAAGKKEADLDGDGDMEKVRESVDEGILAATRNLWKTYRPQ